MSESEEPKRRVYTVVQKEATGEKFISLVRARSPAGALKHVTKSLFQVRLSSQEDLIAFGHVKQIQQAADDPRKSESEPDPGDEE